ncbi:MAG: Unknown protein [uncultured Sulfurovum sp.]|uniref:N-acetyltransferase domain-containing protein n=1 Tax=uncultured Sulfurovum sp. TaxID=269237 RepID=A0A6S6TQ81_9BACT|nr:MAG: Unknown protein [uncultured Sulfurovum sp.]
MIELFKYNHKSASYRLAIDLLDDLELSPNPEQAQREKPFIEDICKRVQKAGTVLYLLKHEEETLGFIALSASSIDDFPSLQVDYLFVNNPYRGVELDFLDNTKTSNYLVEFAIEIATELQENVGLRYLVLLPDNDRLQAIYKEMGFNKLNRENWMFLKL